jgi:hypothetical protein
VSSLGTSQVTLKPGASQVVPITTSAVDFALPGALDLTGVAASHISPSVQAGASAARSIAATTGMSAVLAPQSQTLPLIGSSLFSIEVNNIGNTEDAYSAVIVGTTGPVTASLIGPGGLPTQSIGRFQLPGLSTGDIALDAFLTGPGQATVTVLVKSLSTGQSTTLTATITANLDGPRITSVKRFGIYMMPTTIVLTFDEPLAPWLAENAHEYRLVDSQGHVIRIKSAVYDPSTLTVTLYLERRINFHHKYKLTVLGAAPGGLANPQGLLLDGKNTGWPGSNYTTRLDRHNLVPPPKPDPNPRVKHAGHQSHRSSKPAGHAFTITHHALAPQPPIFHSNSNHQHVERRLKSAGPTPSPLRRQLTIDRKRPRIV